MKTLCVNIAYEKISPAVLTDILMNVPCFATYHEVDEDTFEFSIQARVEDMRYIENIISAFV